MSRRDDHWLRELYDAQWRSMVRMATLLLGSRDAAEDIVQDALVATHSRRRQFDTIDEAGEYLRTAVVNRTRLVERRPDTDPPGAGATEQERVLHTVEHLPQRQREVLVLLHHMKASEADVADTLGISRNAVRSHAHRGAQAVRAALVTQGGPHA